MTNNNESEIMIIAIFDHDYDFEDLLRMSKNDYKSNVLALKKLMLKSLLKKLIAELELMKS
jgi:hypothetical protein